MLSVVIPTYRKAEELARTLEALVPQCATLSGQCELIVVDDGSQDRETRKVIASNLDRLPLREAGSGVNEGRARARNRGWRAAMGEFVLFLDDDIVLEPGSLDAHLRAQRGLPAVYLGIVHTAPAIVDSPLFAYLDSRAVAKLPPGARAPARYFLTQNASLPRAALETVGGFDAAFSTYGFEDMDLAFRVEDACGLDFFQLPAARGAHVHHHTLDDYLQKKRLCGAHSLRLLARKHPQRLRQMRLDILPGLGSRPRGWRGSLSVLLRLSWWLGVPRAARICAAHWPKDRFDAALAPLYDYLVVSAYADGLRKDTS
jgi:glycosyltransferase involved in cell wall biosynthesis